MIKYAIELTFLPENRAQKRCTYCMVPPSLPSTRIKYDLLAVVTRLVKLVFIPLPRPKIQLRTFKAIHSDAATQKGNRRNAEQLWLALGASSWKAMLPLSQAHAKTFFLHSIH